jgi:hypothetical protein
LRSRGLLDARTSRSLRAETEREAQDTENREAQDTENKEAQDTENREAQDTENREAQTEAARAGKGDHYVATAAVSGVRSRGSYQSSYSTDVLEPVFFFFRLAQIAGSIRRLSGVCCAYTF